MSATPPPTPTPTPPPPPNKAIAQGVKDLSSDLASALKSLGVQNTQLISGAGAIFASVVDFTAGGFVGAVVTFVGDVLSLLGGSKSGGPDEVQQLGQALSKQLAQFEQAEAADSLLKWLQAIYNELGPVATAMESLKAWVGGQPPPADALQNILNALNALAPPGATLGGLVSTGPYWMVPFNYQVYWDDTESTDVQWPWPPYYLGPPLAPEQQHGYHRQAPTADAQTGTVFYYTYILPAYLYVVSVFLAVGVVIDPKFRENWTETVLQPTILALQSVRDTVVNEFTQLSPGSFTSESLTALLATYITDASAGFQGLNPVSLTGAQQGILPSFNSLGPSGKGFILTPGLQIEYGFVEKFSGYSSVGIYTILTSSDSFSFASGPNYYGKFQIRLTKRQKDVYVGTGMAAVTDAIDKLNAIVTPGTPLPGPSMADWSVRHDIAPFANVTAPNGTISLVAIQNFLLNTPPTDFTEGPLIRSFRAALNV